MDIDEDGEVLATMLAQAEPKLNAEERVLFICISVALVIMAGLMSGLTIGLMAMDDMEMEVSVQGLIHPAVVLHDCCSATRQMVSDFRAEGQATN
jgi:hypothetical protein